MRSGWESFSNDWAAGNASFLENDFRGPSQGPHFIEVGRDLKSSVVFTALHGVKTQRGNESKSEDERTGGLVLALAKAVGVRAFAVVRDMDYLAGAVIPETWNERDDEIKTRLERLLGKADAFVIDVHGMKNQTSGVDVCIGRGPNPDGFPRLAEEIKQLKDDLEKQGLKVSIDVPFAAKTDKTLTWWAQTKKNLPAIQLELSAEVRDPENPKSQKFFASMNAFFECDHDVKANFEPADDAREYEVHKLKTWLPLEPERIYVNRLIGCSNTVADTREPNHEGENCRKLLVYNKHYLPVQLDCLTEGARKRIDDDPDSKDWGRNYVLVGAYTRKLLGTSLGERVNIVCEHDISPDRKIKVSRGLNRSFSWLDSLIRKTAGSPELALRCLKPEGPEEYYNLIRLSREAMDILGISSGDEVHIQWLGSQVSATVFPMSSGNVGNQPALDPWTVEVPLILREKLWGVTADSRTNRERPKPAALVIRRSGAGIFRKHAYRAVVAGGITFVAVAQVLSAVLPPDSNESPNPFRVPEVLVGSLALALAAFVTVIFVGDRVRHKQSSQFDKG
jgi:hypothetical protein